MDTCMAIDEKGKSGSGTRRKQERTRKMIIAKTSKCCAVVKF